MAQTLACIYNVLLFKVDEMKKWTIEKTDFGIRILDQEGFDVCPAEGPEIVDAQLIAAAPDLLEACSRLIDAFYSGDNFLGKNSREAAQLAELAIAKANGEEK